MSTNGDIVRGYKSDLPEHADTLDAIATKFDDLADDFAKMNKILAKY